MRGFNLKSSNMTMGELVVLSKELEGLRSTYLGDEGNFAIAMPKQIIREGVNKYSGLPELIMAEEFANIPVTLERDYVNYKLSDIPEIFKGIFNYDLNKHLIINLLDLRAKIANTEWFESQPEEVQSRLQGSKFFMVEDGKLMLKPKEMLCASDYSSGDILKHIDSYSTEIVFYADPQAGYKLEPEGRFNTIPVFYKVSTKQEAEALGVEIGTYVKTPLLKFINFYNAAFNKLYIEPIRAKYPNMPKTEFNKLPEVEEANKQRLVSKPAYRVITLLNKITLNNKDEIEIEGDAKIPTYLNKMELKSHQLTKYFSFPKDSDVHFEPSFALLKMNVPKRDGNTGQAFREQYEGIKVNKPESTIKQGREDDRVPTLHSKDKEYAKRFKETMLDFPFKQAYVTSGSQGFSAPLKLSAIYEIIRHISLPIYMKLEDGDFNKENIKNFLLRDIGMTEEQFNQRIAELSQSGGQFSGAPMGQQPTQQFNTVPQQGGYINPTSNPYGGQMGTPPVANPAGAPVQTGTPPVANPYGGQPIADTTGTPTANPAVPPIPLTPGQQ